MPTSRETSLKCGTEAVCAFATRGKIRTSDRICRITMSVQIIEQRKSINHEGLLFVLCGENAVHVEYRFSCLDRDPGRESHENVCALFICRPVVPGPAWFRPGSLCWRRDPQGCVEARH